MRGGLDIIIIAIIALAIFGPKTLQSLASSAGKHAAKVKQTKEQVMSDLSIDEFTKLSDSLPKIPQIPRNASQAVNMLLADDEKKTKSSAGSSKTAKASVSASSGAKPAATEKELA